MTACVVARVEVIWDNQGISYHFCLIEEI